MHNIQQTETYFDEHSPSNVILITENPLTVLRENNKSYSIKKHSDMSIVFPLKLARKMEKIMKYVENKKNTESFDKII